MGIELASWFAHIWFLKELAEPSRHGARHDPARHRTLLPRNLRGHRSGMTPLNRAQILSEDDYLAKVENYGDDFTRADGCRRHP